MKLDDVAVGKVYEARVGDRLTAVRVERLYLYRPGASAVYHHYIGRNLRTGKEVSGTAAKLRREIPTGEEAVAEGLLTANELDRAYALGYVPRSRWPMVKEKQAPGLLSGEGPER